MAVFVEPGARAAKPREKEKGIYQTIWLTGEHSEPIRTIRTLAYGPTQKSPPSVQAVLQLLPPQSPRGFSALARLYYLATKTAMLRRLGKNQRFEGVLSRNCFEKRRGSALNTFVFSELFSAHFNKYLIFIKDIKPYPERGYKLRTYHLILRCL